MPATARVPLGPATVNRKWWIDLNSGTYEIPVWTPVNGITDFTPGYEPSLQDDSDFDSLGAGSDVVTAYKWSIELTVARKVKADDPEAYDPGQEALRTAASKKTGLANVVDIRWYEMNLDDDGEVIGPLTEAHRGFAAAQFAHEGGAYDALSTATITLSGRGAYEDIEHPEATAAVPEVLALSPATGPDAGGTLVLISGNGFTGAEEVLFGAEEAEFAVLNDNQIYAVAPAQTAGAVAVSVENATGVSTVNLNYVYTE